ncbi:MAG: VWA domain-containing protein [Opitutales bacterium]|nr:VWA domain-containing protein [Opitutales bacterium]
MMRFDYPEWFLFTAVVAVLGWRFPSLRLHRPSRLVLLLLLTLIWTGLSLRMPSEALHLWVLMDKSDSIRDVTARNDDEWLDIIEGAQPRDAHLHIIDYGQRIIERGLEPAIFPEEAGSETRLRAALQQVLFRSNPDDAHRVLIISDGYATDNPSDLIQPFVERGIPVDFRFARAATVDDLAVVSLDGPQSLQSREAVIISGSVNGPEGSMFDYEFRRDDTVIAAGSEVIRDGRVSLRVADRPSQGGVFRYQLRVNSPDDPTLGNNERSFWMRVDSPPRVLLLTSFENDPVAILLEGLDFPVDVASPQSVPEPAKLAGYRLVILNNIGASTLGESFMNELNAWVQKQGGGLLMIGGRRSFGTGGYFESPLDEVLPVSMETREDHKRLAVAMSIVLDRSGSMGASVGNGMSKMDLANSGSAAAVDLLSDYDAISIFAVDSTPDMVVPLTQVGRHRSEIIQRAASVAAGGGGIFVYEGLAAAWQSLQKSTAGQRHVILFSDAADSEQPGDYKNLISEMRAGKTTISVIALGRDTDADADAAFLKDIAIRGEGRIFFSEQPSSLPAIFSQETVAVARSAFVEEYTPLVASAGWFELAQSDIQWPELIYGYNLSYVRDGASSAARSGDESDVPLLAFWNIGSGRSAALTFSFSGEDGAFNRQWPQAGEMLVTTARWLIGQSHLDGVLLRSRLDGNDWLIDLHYDVEWARRIDQQPPVIQTKEAGEVLIQEHTWTRLERGRMRVRIPVEAGKTLSGVVAVEDTILPLSPVTASMDAEWARDSRGPKRLAQLSDQTEGHERLRLDEAWQPIQRSQWMELDTPLMIAALVVFLLDALLTRIGSIRALRAEYGRSA